MTKLVDQISIKNYDNAKSLFEEKMAIIVEKKKVELKKVIASKMCEEDSNGLMTRAKNWVRNNATGYTAASVASTLAQKAIGAIPKIGSGLAGPVGIGLDVALSPTQANAGEEEELKKRREGQQNVATAQGGRDG